MYKPSIETVEKLSKEFTIIPIYKEIFSDVITPISALRKIQSISKKCYLLESVEGGEKWGRYSFIGFDPIIELKYNNNILNIINNNIKKIETNNPNIEINNILKKYNVAKIHELPAFIGGFVGYYSIDYKNKINNNSLFSQFHLMLFNKVIAFDNLKQKITIIYNIESNKYIDNYNYATTEIEKISKLLLNNSNINIEKGTLLSKYNCDINNKEYNNKINEIKNNIKSGNTIFDTINISYEAEYKGSLLNPYRVLRTTTPSPYMFYFNFDDCQIIGSSDLTLFKLNNDNITSFISTGRKPRGKTEDEDNIFIDELINDENEVAKHNIIIDGVKNDFSKISKFSSLSIDNYKKVEKNTYSINITSQINGKIKDNLFAADIIDNLLPSPIISGLPKKNINTSKNNIYGGAIGYIDFTGNADFCIATNMAILKNEKIYINIHNKIFINDDENNKNIELLKNNNPLIDAINIAGEL